MKTINDDDKLDFDKLHNLPLTSEVFKSLESKYHPQVKAFDNITYMSFFNQGYSFCFKDGLFDSVFYYNNDINSFKKYSKALPYDITFDMKNVNIVQKFGDTPRKGGGKMPIFLCYPHLGIEITFLNSNWNDMDNPIIYISQFAINTKDTTLYCSTCTKAITTTNKYLSCNNANCKCVNYCNETCKSQHIQYHLFYCKPIIINTK